MKKENRGEVNKLKTEKMKVEDELRTAILEKNLLRDSERILLNTFDTLKMHYEAKKKMDDDNDAKKNNGCDAKKKAEETNRKKDNKNEADKEKLIQCDNCDFKTDKVKNLRAHIVNVHDPLYDNIKTGSVVHRCNVCDYKTPFVVNLNIHRDEVHKKAERQGRSESTRVYAHGVRRDNGFCRNWNRSYSCSFENNCKFLHEDAPVCYFGDRCRRKTSCRYFHEELFSYQNKSFLGQGQNQGQWGM